MIDYRLFFSVLVILLFATSDIYSVPVTWDDQGNDKAWTNPLNWDGDIVPTAADDVFIHSGFSVVLGSSTTIQSLSLLGVLLIENSAQLNVFVGFPNAVTIQGGDLTVDGTLTIGLVDTYGVEIIGSGKLNIKGSLNIDQIGQTGIHITNNSTLSIQFGATVNISDVTTGISCISGTVNSQGRIDISENNGTNGSAVSVGGLGTFSNNSFGRVDISDFNAAPLTTGISNLNEFTNSGSLTIGQISRRGIDNDRGTFTNNGSINVNTSQGVGIYINALGVFNNNMSGNINIEGIEGSTFSNACMDIRGSSFMNMGIIELTNFESRGILNMAINGFENHGTISISTATSGTPIINSTSFINAIDGGIWINLDSTFEVLANTGQFENHGRFNADIFQADRFIISHTSGSTFINSGSITAEAGSGGVLYGFRCLSGTSVNNSGSIDMNFNNFSTVGLELIGLSSFVNQSTGTIELSYGSLSTGESLVIEEGSVLDDYGQITIREY